MDVIRAYRIQWFRVSGIGFRQIYNISVSFAFRLVRQLMNGLRRHSAWFVFWRCSAKSVRPMVKTFLTQPEPCSDLEL